nr:serine/threonine-protein kinase [Myxococcus sp. RHSTA-1-4]
MAQIYLARRQGPDASDALLVVKRILPHLTDNDDFIKMFLDEARIAARLNHPNVVQIFDLGAQGDSFFIAMEYIHGEDLRKLWKEAETRGQPVPVPLVCRILIETCAGLDYAHKRTDPATGRPLGIVHRDVSPQNILVTFEGGVKVVDFGIAKAADQATVTRSGVLKGKYAYMSPEQAAGQRVDCRADIFALGVVLYELLTGTRLFKRATDMQTLTAVSECRVVPPSQLSERVPRDLDAIVLKALAKEPAERYQEAAQLQQALEAWLAAHRLPGSSAHLAAYMRELYAERLAAEARSGEVQVEESEPSPQPPRPEAPSRRTGLRPALPRTRTPPALVEETAAQRPRAASRPARLEPEPEPERPAPRSMTGTRRALEAPNERPSRPGPGGVPAPPPVDEEEDGPTMDIRIDARGTRSDVTAPPVPEARTVPRVMPQAGRPDAVPPHEMQVEDDGPTLAMPEVVRAARVVVPVAPENEAEEDAPTLSLALSRPARPAPSVVRPAAAPAAGLRRWHLAAGGGLLVAVVVAALVWAWPGPPPATVRLETLPPGATVVFEGQPLMERTPLVLPPMEAGRYSVVLSREGYEELRTTVEVPAAGSVSPGLLRLVPLASKGEPRVAVFPPEAAASARVRLRVETVPAEAIVFVNGQRQGPAPVEVRAVAGTELAVRAEAAKHHPLVRAVKVGQGPTQVEHLELQPETPAEGRMGRVRFVVQRGAEVTCDGRWLGEAPFEAVELRVGTHECKFFQPDLKKTLSRRIEVSPVDINVVSVKFD